MGKDSLPGRPCTSGRSLQETVRNRGRVFPVRLIHQRLAGLLMPTVLNEPGDQYLQLVLGRINE